MNKANYRYYCHLPGLEFMQLLESVEGLPSQEREDGRILRIAYFLENYIGKVDWQYHYIRDRYCYVCHTKKGRKTRALGEISWYHRMYNVIAEVSHRPRSL
jgi:hypothetical protein